MAKSFSLHPFTALMLSASLVVLSGCKDKPHFSAAEPDEALSGGTATVHKFDANAFSQPSANLSPLRRLDFGVGNSFFRNPWVIAPSSTEARDGLGPLFNTNACQNCHVKDGRGHPPGSMGDNAITSLVRLSIPAKPGQEESIRQHGVIPEPVYGGQLQDMGVPGVEPEAQIKVTYTPEKVSFRDGSEVELQRPRVQVLETRYGALHPDTLLSLRVAPPMIGLGLLEAIPEQTLLANADPDDRNQDGISGRPNYVWDRASQMTQLGRFGWKAGQPGLNQQNAEAFLGDMGLSSHLVPGSNCTATQTTCLTAPTGGSPEVSDVILAQVLFYSRNLAVPARREVNSPQVLEGKGLFHQAGCHSCHTPTFTTDANAAEPELSNQKIHPYSDLLLHDMGDGLADNRPEFQATGREWRTPPLWGIGMTETVNGHTRFLHDGRARNLMEAVLWHGGEADAAKTAVLAFNAHERAALLAFLNSL